MGKMSAEGQSYINFFKAFLLSVKLPFLIWLFLFFFVIICAFLTRSKFMFPCSASLAEKHHLAANQAASSGGPACAVWGHRILGTIESIPVLGDIVALIEKVILAGVHFWTSCVQNTSSQGIQNAQPLIESNGWGHITLRVNNASTRFRDAIIYPSGAEEWNWQWNGQSPMHHVPGVRVQDVDHFISRCKERPEAIILTQGRGHGGGLNNSGAGILQIEPNVETHLRGQGFSEIHILKTAPALQRYEELRASGKRVLALVHTTC